MLVCTACHKTTLKWAGKCPHCNEWNTLVEDIQTEKWKTKKLIGNVRDVQKFESESENSNIRIVSASGELDNVLGGGMVSGSLILLSGEPGIWKSTLSLQLADWCAGTHRSVLYVSGEEHIGQISERACRLGIANEYVHILTTGVFEDITATIHSGEEEVIIIDSLSVLGSTLLDGTSGSISQVRIMTETFMDIAKKSRKTIILIWHVTKDGSIWWPKALEHLVDVVLFLEGSRNENYRILRAMKNRFGPTDTVGLFRMTEKGMIDIPNPGMEFIEKENTELPGSALSITLEGTRPLLIEIEALTTYSKFGYPKRSSRGISQGRVDLLIAVIQKFTTMKLETYDVYTNVGRGLSLSDPGIDLACIAAILSSRMDVPLRGTIWLGEVSLTGIVKPVNMLERRISEAAKLGFVRIVVPAGYDKKWPTGVELICIKNIADMIGVIR